MFAARPISRRAFVLSSGAALASCAAPMVAKRRTFALAGELDAAIARAMATGVAPGLSVAVYSRDGTYARGFGVTDVATGERADADTAFYVASCTKSFTALALAQLHERKVLSLDASLAVFAPDARWSAQIGAQDVKLRHMLSHTSGVANDALGYRVAFTGQHDPETLWRLLGACAPNSKAPLGKFEYTNVGYNITTVLTDRRLGLLWQDLLHREIFGPIGMTRSSARMSPALGAGWRVAKAHMQGFSGGPEPIYLNKTDQTMQSAGGVIMSANDAARWLELMVEDGRIGGRQIVPAEAVLATRSPLAEVNSEFQGYKREHYGLGWYAGPYRDEHMFHHFGGFAGFRSHVSYIPARHIGVAAIVNDSTAAYPIVDVIANYVYDITGGYTDAQQRLDEGLAALDKRRTDHAARLAEDREKRSGRKWQLSAPMSAYAGTYENEQWGRIEVSPKGDTFEVRFGVLRARAEPYTKLDTVRVEFVPYNGEPIAFEMAGAKPNALTFQEQRFARR